MQHAFSKYNIPEYMIMDQDSACMSTLIKYLFKKLDIKIRKNPYIHQSLQAAHGIESLATITSKHLVGLRQYWPKYLPSAVFSYNTFCSPHLNELSPYELVFGRKPKLLINLETDPNVKVSGTFKGYYELLNESLEYLQKLLFDFKMKLSVLNKEREFFQYKSRDLVYIICPLPKST